MRVATRVQVTPVRRTAALVAAALVAAVLASPTTAAAQSDEELRRELEQHEGRASDLGSQLSQQRAQVSEAEEELAAIGARLADARGQLQVAEGQLALAEVALEEAEAERVEAEEEHEAAEAELARVEAELEAEEQALATQAVAAYKFGSVGARAGSAAFDVMRRAKDPNELAVGMRQIGKVIDLQGVTVARVLDLRNEAAELTELAAAARARAVQAAADAAEQVRRTEQLRAEAAALTTQIADEEAAQAAATRRLRAEAAETKESLDRVASRQKAIEGELAARRAAEEAARRKKAAAGGGGGGAGGGPPIDGVCPVPGGRFINDWGFPRGSDRTHQGNDIFADKGTPVVAIADGVVLRMDPPSRPTRLGGITITYRTGDGSEWYNAHLDTISSGVSVGTKVSKGQQVGTVGNTGNAKTTPPHNHIQRKYDGRWVNPYPTIRPLC